MPCATQTPSGAASGAPDQPCENSRRAPARVGIRLFNRPSDGRTGGTPETSARTPGGPPDDVNTGLTFVIPNANIF